MKPLRVVPGKVHVWRMRFGDVSISAAKAWVAMDDPERVRARSFRFQRDCDRFCQTRWFLRRALGRCLGCKPNELRFDREPNGKPYVSPASNPYGLEFSLTHCKTSAMLAVAHGQRVGIDAEDLQTIPESLALATHLFGFVETALMRSAPVAERSRIFLNCWTKKEALLKAVGVGLDAPKNALSIISAGNRTVVQWNSPSGTQELKLQLADLSRGSIVATLAAEQISEEIETADFET